MKYHTTLRAELAGPRWCPGRSRAGPRNGPPRRAWQPRFRIPIARRRGDARL